MPHDFDLFLSNKCPKLIIGCLELEVLNETVESLFNSFFLDKNLIFFN